MGRGPWGAVRHAVAAAALVEAGPLDRARQERYAGWDGELGRRIMAGATLAELSESVQRDGLDPQPRSGRQERLENVVNRYV